MLSPALVCVPCLHSPALASFSSNAFSVSPSDGPLRTPSPVRPQHGPRVGLAGLTLCPPRVPGPQRRPGRDLLASGPRGFGAEGPTLLVPPADLFRAVIAEVSEALPHRVTTSEVRGWRGRQGPPVVHLEVGVRVGSLSGSVPHVGHLVAGWRGGGDCASRGKS